MSVFPLKNTYSLFAYFLASSLMEKTNQNQYTLSLSFQLVIETLKFFELDTNLWFLYLRKIKVQYFFSILNLLPCSSRSTIRFRLCLPQQAGDLSPMFYIIFQSNYALCDSGHNSPPGSRVTICTQLLP